MQSRKMSLLESVINILVGYGISVGAQIAIFPLFGLHASISDNLKMGGLFTIVSLARSYCIRRVFNALLLWGK